MKEESEDLDTCAYRPEGYITKSVEEFSTVFTSKEEAEEYEQYFCEQK